MTRAPWVATGFFLASVVAAGSGPQQKPATASSSTPQPATAAAATMKSSGPPFVMLRITDVKLDMMSEYVALQKSDTIPGLQKAGVEWRDAWRSAVVGTANTIAFVTPLKSLADLDGDNPMQRAVGAEGYRAYMDKMSKVIASSRVYILRPRPDLGYRSEAAGNDMPSKLGVLADVQVVPGRQPDFEAILKTEWAPGLKKANVPSYTVSEVLFGGGIGQYYTFTPIANFAALEKGHPIQQSLGEAGLNRLMAKMGPSIRHAERIIIRYDEELSFKAAPKPKTDSQ
jgi:hypothetical protein